VFSELLESPGEVLLRFFPRSISAILHENDPVLTFVSCCCHSFNLLGIGVGKLIFHKAMKPHTDLGDLD
jgi:hypothetical protein